MNTETLPTIQEELARKTVDHLTELVHRVETHRKDEHEVAAIASALHTVTAGLIDDEVGKMIAAVAGAYKAKPMKRHFAGRGEIRTVAWFATKPGFVVIRRDANGVKTIPPTVLKSELGEREGHLTKLFDGLKAAGYTEL